MFIAVEGCCHGELNKIYETLQFIEKKEKIEISLLLCCGDFQSVRNESDLHSMAVPDKHKSMQDFWQYYCGQKKAPYLTIFIGGNHEASNYLQVSIWFGCFSKVFRNFKIKVPLIQPNTLLALGRIMLL